MHFNESVLRCRSLFMKCFCFATPIRAASPKCNYFSKETVKKNCFFAKITEMVSLRKCSEEVLKKILKKKRSEKTPSQFWEAKRKHFINRNLHRRTFLLK